MLHLMKYRLLLCLRDRSSMFWGLCFPLQLSTLFYFTIMQGGKDTSVLEPVKVAFVSCKAGSDGQADGALQAGSDGQADTISTIKKEQSEKMAAAGGVGSSVGDGSSQVGSSAIDDNSLADDSSHSYTHTVTLGGHSMDGNMQYFFALIAMTCLYGCFLGLNATLKSRANLSPLGLRRSVTPTHKLKLVLSDMLVTFFMQTLNLLVLLLFLTRILGLDLGGFIWGNSLRMRHRLHVRCITWNSYGKCRELV